MTKLVPPPSEPKMVAPLVMIVQSRFCFHCNPCMPSMLALQMSQNDDFLTWNVNFLYEGWTFLAPPVEPPQTDGVVGKVLCHNNFKLKYIKLQIAIAFAKHAWHNDRYHALAIVYLWAILVVVLIHLTSWGSIIAFAYQHSRCLTFIKYIFPVNIFILWRFSPGLLGILFLLCFSRFLSNTKLPHDDVLIRRYPSKLRKLWGFIDNCSGSVPTFIITSQNTSMPI